MVNGNDYELVDEPLEHEGCIRIPYPGTAYAWPRVFFAPAEKRFFYDFYSTGAIADDELRYHGSEDLSIDEVKRLFAGKWPPNERG